MNATHIRDLASLVAGIIQRMGASYGSGDDWQRDFIVAVKIMEQANVEVVKQTQKEAGNGSR